MRSENKMDILYTIDGKEVLIEDIQLERKETVAEMFLKARKEKNYTQKTLADITGMDRANIARFEAAKYNPSLEMMTRIASALGKKLVITLEENDDQRIVKTLEAYSKLITKKNK